MTESDSLTAMSIEFNINLTTYPDFSTAFSYWYALYDDLSEALKYLRLKLHAVDFIINTLRTSAIRVQIGQDEVDRAPRLKSFIELRRQLAEEVEAKIRDQDKGLTLMDPVGIEW